MGPNIQLVPTEGVIVRQVINVEGWGDYMVLWCKEYNHCFIYRSDLQEAEWQAAYDCEWKAFEVDVNPCDGPEGIETRAYNLRMPPDECNDPSTRPDQLYTDIHNQRRVNVFSKVEKEGGRRATIKFKDVFTVPRQKVSSTSCVHGKFIKNALIKPADLRELHKFEMWEFEGVVELLKITKRAERHPWTITQFVHEGKELSMHGWLSKHGKLLRGARGKGMLPRTLVTIPQDGLRLAVKTAPSRFALATSCDPPPAPVPSIVPFGSDIVNVSTDSSWTSTTQDRQSVLSNGRQQESSANQSLERVSLSITDNNDNAMPSMAADAFRDRVISVEPTKITGFVVFKDSDHWIFYSKDFFAPNREYLKLYGDFDLTIGTWYSFMYHGVDDPETIQCIGFCNIDNLEEVPPPSGVVQRVFRHTKIMHHADVLLTVRAEVLLNQNGYELHSRPLGWLSLSSDAEEVIDFTKLKSTVVEVMASPVGLMVRRMHGPNVELENLPEPLIPYNVRFQEEVIELCDGLPAFTVSINEHEDWLRVKADPSIQPALDDAISELRELEIPRSQSPPILDRGDVYPNEVRPRNATEDSQPTESAVNAETLDSSMPRRDYYDIQVNLAEEAMDNTFIYENVVAMIAKVTDAYIVAFSPLPGYDKIIIMRHILEKSPFMSKCEGRIELGQWMCLGVHERMSKASDEHFPPEFSHFASEENPQLPELMAIEDCVPTWNQRYCSGVFQFLVTVDFSGEWLKDTKRFNDETYLIVATGQEVEVIIPESRVKSIGCPNWYQTSIRFWADRGPFLFGHTLHLFDFVCMELFDPELGDWITLNVDGSLPDKQIVDNTEDNTLPPPCPFDTTRMGAVSENSDAISQKDHTHLPAVNGIKHNDEDLLVRAHRALFRLDNPAVVNAFRAEYMEGELNHLINLREAIRTKQAPLSVLRLG